jgi:hypothetical protein
MKKITLAIFSLIFVFNGLAIFAQSIADPADVFYVVNPTPNQKVKGTIPVSFRMYDDEQTTIAYTATLFDFSSCKDTSYGSITASQSGASNKTQNTIIGWDTRRTQTTNPLSDGKYCLKICVALKNGTTPYSVCNSRDITVINNNHLPVITSSPSGTTIKEDATWQYQVNATDADGDTLRYRLVATPNFLSINSSTGLIQTNSNSKALPADIYRATYTITIGVSDDMSGETYQTFNLTIYKDLPTPPADDDTGDDDQDDTDDDTADDDDTEPTNSPSEIEVQSPKAGDILKGTENELKWSASDADGILEIELSYSKDGEDWTSISTLEEGVTSYKWDVTNIEDGEYFLKVSVKDSEEIISAKISEKFQIKNKDDEEEPTETSPLIINVVPDNNTEITDTLRPEISGEFVPSQDAEIDTTTFKISLDDKDILEKCTVDAQGFTCSLDEDLKDGLHNVKANVKDSSEQEASREWQFNIKGQTTESDEEKEGYITVLGREIPRNSVLIVLGICLITLVLLLIPWILYTLWRRRQNGGNSYESTTTDYSYTPPSSDLSPQTDLTTNYYYPPVDTTYTTPTTTETNNYYYPPVEPAVQSEPESTPVEPTPNYTQTGDVGTQTTTEVSTTTITPATPADSTTQTTVTTESNPVDDYMNYLNQYSTSDQQMAGTTTAPQTDSSKPADGDYVEPKATS